MTRMSMRSHLGSIMATAVVFLAIASTSLRMKDIRPARDNERPIYYLAPPEEFVETQAATPKSAANLETFAVDLSALNETMELTLTQIDVSFNPEISAKHFLNMGMTRDFQAAAPELDTFSDFMIFDRSEVDDPPKLRYAAQPEVPFRYRGQEVEVIAFYYVNNKGKTEKPSILHSSSPDSIFAQAAKRAITDWKFRPARKNGQAVACWVQQTIKFNRGSTSPFML